MTLSYTIINLRMNRNKITITLRKELIKRIDETVDGEKIRNRSHAIEYLLGQILAPKVRKALILAGGRGIKMKPLTEELPKPLLPVHGRPLLEHQIDILRNADIRNIYILIGHLGEKIKYYFGDGSKFGINITYIEQPATELGTGYAAYLARNFFTSEPFLMLYGDELIAINLKDFVDYYLQSSPIAAIALTSTKHPHPYGAARLRGDSIVEFMEKPNAREASSHVISAGLFCFNPKIFEYLHAKTNLALEKNVFPKLARENNLKGYLFEGQWFDIGTSEVYAKAIKEWKGG